MDHHHHQHLLNAATPSFLWPISSHPITHNSLNFVHHHISRPLCYSPPPLRPPLPHLITPGPIINPNRLLPLTPDRKSLPTSHFHIKTPTSLTPAHKTTHLTLYLACIQLPPHHSYHAIHPTRLISLPSHLPLYHSHLKLTLIPTSPHLITPTTIIVVTHIINLTPLIPTSSDPILYCI